MCVSMHTLVNVWTLEQSCAIPGGGGAGRGRVGGAKEEEEEEEESVSIISLNGHSRVVER